MHRPLVFTFGFACAALAPGAARAETPEPSVAMYALVVGSNTGGPGQVTLRYSEDDAHRMAATLIELGGYTADAVDIVVHPSPDALRDHLGKLAARVAADRAAGRQARVLFYYSGHARGTAIDLGVVPSAFTITGTRANHVCASIAAAPGAEAGTACLTLRPE